MQLLQELLPNFIAALIPSGLLFIQSIWMITKNIKSSGLAEDLEGLMNELKVGNLNVEKIVNDTIPKIKGVVDGAINDIVKVKDEIIEDITKEFKAFRKEQEALIKEQKAIYHQTITNLKTQIKDLKIKAIEGVTKDEDVD